MMCPSLLEYMKAIAISITATTLCTAITFTFMKGGIAIVGTA